MYSLKRTNKVILLLFCIFISSLIGLIFRLQTLLDFSSGIIPIVMHEDPWYTIRQIEQVIHNYPSYAWFDPMLNFPNGQMIQWGPLLPFMGATLCIFNNITTQGEIIRLVSWLPPVLFLLMVPICYLIGKMIWNKKVGILSAIFVTIVNGEFLYRSMYGNLDHHILEVVISFACILGYLFIIRNITCDTRKVLSKNCVFTSIITGILFFLGYMNIPTIMIVALTISVFYFFFIIFEKDMNKIVKLLISNILIFTTFSVLYLLSGVPYDGFSIRSYTYGAIGVAIIIIIASVFLYALKGYIICKDKRCLYLLFSLLFLIVFCNIIVPHLIIDILFSFSNSFYSFFQISGNTAGIDELEPLSLLRAILSYNIAIVLSFIGFIVVCYTLFLHKNRLLLFFFIWGVILSIISIMQVRYQYYEGPVICILSAICLDMVYRKTIIISENRKDFLEKRNLDPKMIGLLIVILISCTFYLISLSIGFYVLPTFYGKSIKSNWMDTSLWLKNNTPDNGIDYYKIYDRESFSYPSNTYTIVNWWNFGHYILTIGNRIPLGSPLQENDARISASFLLTTNESSANEIIAPYNAQYVITNYDLSLVYPTVVLWSHLNYPYDNYMLDTILKKNAKTSLLKGLKNDFFLSMFTRMHYFDGSFQEATEKNIISYVNIPMGNENVSMLVNEEELKNNKISPQYLQKDEVSFNYTRSCVDIPALTSYRLVYESPQIVSNLTYAEIHNIKIFEHVKGHTIPGTGTIELPLVTNQGREFVYRQQSVNNSFTLPYSTTNTPYDVHATGPYRIIETNETIDVDESQIERYYK
ncbi:oligosaccharyl transferase, archaeosortase A system-associated [Methanospirillum stamsii]|uniref:dolichyl-phosphooligosaccharide-protein glycotransferase n=1 Tax=Methanospirillum stamsii TaxID=1277351 RepID=A0A2V2NDR8_9EURY|nr:oligosaccharyl transferase, archaeosortase A system-associated [Methanospirillum stamsii]PWR73443.1 hypothetical protein DLD82_09330 [Methanospirillum stamsii]